MDFYGIREKRINNANVTHTCYFAYVNYLLEFRAYRIMCSRQCTNSSFYYTALTLTLYNAADIEYLG